MHVVEQLKPGEQDVLSAMHIDPSTLNLTSLTPQFTLISIHSNIKRCAITMLLMHIKITISRCIIRIYCDYSTNHIFTFIFVLRNELVMSRQRINDKDEVRYESNVMKFVQGLG